jgi:hypothetical protein
LLSPPPNLFPSRIADKAFYQQPDADIIGYVYVVFFVLCQGVAEVGVSPVWLALGLLSLQLVGYK